MNKSGFTLIEVLVATVIASVALIGTFFLLQGSFRQSQTVIDSTEFEEVFLNARNCIFLQDIPSFSGSTQSISYNSNGCAVSAYSTDFNFPGITLWKSLQGIPSSTKVYYSYFSVTSGTSTGEYFIDHHLVGDIRNGTRKYKAYR
jgi:prepilin-type N-terminal cleavage/methylation domain-containing protein